MNLLAAAAVFLIASATAAATAEWKSPHSSVNKAAAAAMNAKLVGKASSVDEVVVTDDDYKELVRQVIEENPPEEQGIRPEWEERVGWNRKEDIYNTHNKAGAEFVLDDYDEFVRQVIEENPPEEQGIRPEWEERVGWNRKEDIFNTHSSIEGPADRLEAQPAILDGPADMAVEVENDNLLEVEARHAELGAVRVSVRDGDIDVLELADVMKEKPSLKAGLAEVFESWFDINNIMGYLTPASLFILYQVVAPYITPAKATNFACNAVANQFVDSSTAEPICDTLSHAVIDDLVKLKEQVINFIF